MGVIHGLLNGDPHGDRHSDPSGMAHLIVFSSGGTATLADAAGFPCGPRPGPLPVWHSGQGGEVARAYYGLGDARVADRLYARFTGRRPGRAEIISAEAASVVRRRIGDFVQRMSNAGAAALDIPDLFYLLERMACWAAPTHGVMETIRDTTSPLWSRRMLPHMLGLPARERVLERFHLLVLQQLAPKLLYEPFQDGSVWPSRQVALGRQMRQARRLKGKVKAELRRRRAAQRASSVSANHATHAVTVDPFDAVRVAVRDTALSQPGHVAWSVLDRPRVERLLASPAVSLDEMSRYYVWRLASAFLAPTV
jgi:hypothetical protein